MARLASKLKLGYYPLPVEQGPMLRARLAFPNAPTSALDPCCGTGAAIQALTADSKTKIYGVELDAERAESAKQAGIDTIYGNAFDVRARVERLSFLYLNPPYDTETGSEGGQRMERLFLNHMYSWLRPKGVLLMVIPSNAVIQTVVTLSTRFKDVRIYRMVGAEAERFKQVAVFGVRHDNTGKAAASIQSHIQEQLRTPQCLPVLTAKADCTYHVPETNPVAIWYAGVPVDEMEDRIQSSNLWKFAAPLLLPKPEMSKGRPVTPLHAGHVAVLATAGMLNGVLGKGERRHIARWSPRKYTTETVMVEDGVEVKRTRERYSNEVALVFVTGETHILSEKKQGEQIASVDVVVEPQPPSDPTEAAEADNAEPPTTSTAPAASNSGDPLFDLGRINVTIGVRELMASGLNVKALLGRHKTGDWGEMANDDKVRNDRAVRMADERIFSGYDDSTPGNPDGRIWIITEHDRSVTTIMLPSD